MLDGLRLTVDGSKKKNKISCQESNLRLLGHPSHSLVSTPGVLAVVELPKYCLCQELQFEYKATNIHTNTRGPQQTFSVWLPQQQYQYHTQTVMHK
jgi:hypothetical protein